MKKKKKKKSTMKRERKEKHCTPGGRFQRDRRFLYALFLFIHLSISLSLYLMPLVRQKPRIISSLFLPSFSLDFLVNISFNMYLLWFQKIIIHKNLISKLITQNFMVEELNNSLMNKEIKKKFHGIKFPKGFQFRMSEQMHIT